MSMPDFAGSRWSKSSRSNAANSRVEVAASAEGLAGVRESKLMQHSPVLAFGQGQWSSFVDARKRGDLDPS